jgi:hypothetical protein
MCSKQFVTFLLGGGVGLCAPENWSALSKLTHAGGVSYGQSDIRGSYCSKY